MIEEEMRRNRKEDTRRNRIEGNRKESDRS